VLLNLNRCMREFRFGRHPMLQRVQRMEKPDGKRGTRSQACARRQVAVMVNLEPFRHAKILQDTSHSRMLNLCITPGMFNP
jgi:hypothetical protein